MELTRYRVSCMVLLGMGLLPGYGAAPWVWVVCMPCSVTLSAKIGKAVSQSLPRLDCQACQSKRVFANVRLYWIDFSTVVLVECW